MNKDRTFYYADIYNIYFGLRMGEFDE